MVGSCRHAARRAISSVCSVRGGNESPAYRLYFRNCSPSDFAKAPSASSGTLSCSAIAPPVSAWFSTGLRGRRSRQQRRGDGMRVTVRVATHTTRQWAYGGEPLIAGIARAARPFRLAHPLSATRPWVHARRFPDDHLAIHDPGDVVPWVDVSPSSTRQSTHRTPGFHVDGDWSLATPSSSMAASHGPSRSNPAEMYDSCRNCCDADGHDPSTPAPLSQPRTPRWNDLEKQLLYRPKSAQQCCRCSSAQRANRSSASDTMRRYRP